MCQHKCLIVPLSSPNASSKCDDVTVSSVSIVVISSLVISGICDALFHADTCADCLFHHSGTFQGIDLRWVSPSSAQERTEAVALGRLVLGPQSPTETQHANDPLRRAWVCVAACQK